MHRKDRFLGAGGASNLGCKAKGGHDLLDLFGFVFSHGHKIEEALL